MRFIMANIIMLAHLSELSESEELAFLLSFCKSSLGVSGFFIISGFLVAKSYSKSNDLKKYFIKRTKRIFPAYIFVLMFFVLVLSFFSVLGFTDFFLNIETYKYIFWNLLFLNFMQPCLPGVFVDNFNCAVNGSLWTMKIEEGFYIVLPLIFYLMYKLRKKNAVLVFIYIMSVLYTYVMLDVYNKPLLAKQLPGKLAYFVVGIFIYLNFNKFIIKKWLYLVLALIVMMLEISFVSVNVFFPLVFGTIILFLAYSVPFLNNFSKKSDYTYGIYLFHYPIIQIFAYLKLFDKINPFVSSVSIIILVYFFAYISWHLIEKRFLNRTN
nr:acyltransferase [Flavobacterium sp. H122]